MKRYRAVFFISSRLALLLLASGFSAIAAPVAHWYNIGPRPIDTLDTNLNVIEQDSGRVAALAVDPSNSNHWLLGSAQGGVWETADAGTSWAPRTDDQASMAMGAIAFAPGDPSRVYAGTGEANFRGDDYAGAGLLLSLDGGTHWQMLNSSFAKSSFSRIRVDRLNSQNLTATTTRGGAGVGEESSGHGLVPGAPPRGVFLSTDGGTNFTRVLTGEATALEVSGNNFSNQYAALGEIYGDPTNGVYRTTNAWQTSEQIAGPWVTTITYDSTNIPIATNIVVFCDTNFCGGCSNACHTNIEVVTTNIITGTNITPNDLGRIAMAISPSDPNTLYVGVAQTRTNYLADYWGIWVTTNAWADNPDWTELPFAFVDRDFVSTPRFWYMFDLLVDPVDPTIVYLAEFDISQYASGNWTRLTEWPPTHPDNHTMAWVPRPGSTWQLLIGNDGGVYVSDVGVSGEWTNRNAQLRITQFYKGAVDATGKNLLALGGAQDEFTSRYNGSVAWPLALGGDGGDCAISTADPLNQWAVSLDTGTDHHGSPNDVQIWRTQNGGLFQDDYVFGGTGINDGLPLSQQFYVHFEKAPYNDDLLIAGTTRLWRCTNFFNGTLPFWIPNGPTMLDTNSQPVPLSAMAFAPSPTNGLIYAFATEDGQLRVTSNGGLTWNDLDPSNSVPNRYVSGLAFDPANANILYVTLSGFDESIPGQPGHLFKTANALSGLPVWSNISPPVNLPNDCLAVDPNDGQSILVGTDLGIWHSPDGGGSWAHFGPADGMPNVAVYDLRFTAQSRLTAFTHGRGAFVLGFTNLPVLVFISPNFHPTPNCLTCPPDRLRINPGDEVSINIALQGVLPIDTIDLQATLLPSAQVTPINGTQSYGLLQGQGLPISRTFRFIAAGGGGAFAGPASPGSSCGDAGQLVLQLQDQGVDLGQITIPFQFGLPSHPAAEDFNGGPPALPPGWISSATGTGILWSTTANPPPVTLTIGEDEFSAPPPANTSAFVPDTAGVGQSFLTSPPFPIATPQAQLSFRTAFSVSNAFDGGLLEISIGGQPFQEITQAGGSFVRDGYNLRLSDFNPLGTRFAWSGDSGGWLPVLVNLPSAAAGQPVQFRWHFGTSRGLPNGAWFVDSVLITESVCLPPVTNPTILNPKLSGNFLTFAIDTVTNRNYVIGFKTNLTDAVWQTLEIVPGDGHQQTIQAPLDPGNQRFYRFDVQ